MRYLNPLRWFDFVHRVFAIMRHDRDLIRLTDIHNMWCVEEMILDHLDNRCARCQHLFGHIYPERVKK